MSSVATALTKLKGWPTGAGIGALLMALYLWKRPERLDDVSPALLLVIAALLGAWIQERLTRLAGWLSNPLFRHLEASWEATLERWRLRVVTRRGEISEPESRRLRSTIGKRDIKGEAGPYEPPRRRNRSPKPPKPPQAKGESGSSPSGSAPPSPKPKPGDAPPESDV